MIEVEFLLRLSEVETSSTYFHILVSGEVIRRLLTITRNKIGPSFVPGGTPAFTESQSEVAPSNLTRCFRFERKLMIQGINERLAPKFISFSINRL